MGSIYYCSKATSIKGFEEIKRIITFFCSLLIQIVKSTYFVNTHFKNSINYDTIIHLAMSFGSRWKSSSSVMLVISSVSSSSSNVNCDTKKGGTGGGDGGTLLSVGSDSCVDLLSLKYTDR